MRPIRRHHKRVQESLGRNKQPKWKSEKLNPITDPSNPFDSGGGGGGGAGAQGIADPLHRFATGVHTNANTTMLAASAFLKPKAEAASSYFKPKPKAFYTHNPFSKSSATLFSNPQPRSKSRGADADATSETDALAEAGFAGYAAQAGQLDPVPWKLPMVATTPVSDSKESASGSSSSSRRGEEPHSAVSPLTEEPEQEQEQEQAQSPSHPNTSGGGDAASEGGRGRAGAGAGASGVFASPSPGVTPPARSVSSSSTAWETQAGQLSPVGSPGSPRSPIGSLDNHSTGNLLAMNPSMNETYIAERDFQPHNPGQLALRTGHTVGISQTFENGWVSFRLFPWHFWPSLVPS